MFDLARAVHDRIRAQYPVIGHPHPLAALSVLEIQAVLAMAEEISTQGTYALLHHLHDPDPESGICRKDGCMAVDYDTYQRHQDALAERERCGWMFGGLG
jgi:hypothetical protein